MRPRAQLWLPTAPAQPEDPRGGRAKVHARLQGRRGAGFGGDLGAVEARRGGREAVAAAGPGPEGQRVGGSAPGRGEKNTYPRPPG
jgi:hypothetical protein